MKIINKLLFILVTLVIISCTKETNPTEPEQDHFKAYGLVIESSGVRILTYFNLFTKDTLFVPLGITDHYEVKFLDKDSNLISPPEDKDKKFGWIISDTSMLEVYRHGEEWEFHLKGKKIGSTFIEFMVLHNDHPDFRTTKIPVVIKDISGQHGAPIGLRAYYEDNGKLIAESPLNGSNGLVKGEFSLKVNETSKHITLKFFDEQNREFQPSVGHKLVSIINDPKICELIPIGDDEPWSFKLKGLTSGITQISFKIAGSDNKIHKEFMPIYIKVD